MSLQSHSEVLNALDSRPPLLSGDRLQDPALFPDNRAIANGKLFVASVSPQVRASLAATYKTSDVEAGWMLDQLLTGPLGLASGGKYGNSFVWVVDTNSMREACLVLGADELSQSMSRVQPPSSSAEETEILPKRPILSSACPGWVCYVEKNHPHVLQHLSRLKSPQALTGTMLKTVISQKLGVRPDQIWHLAVMPCFDKKLEASREELTDEYWRQSSSSGVDSRPPVRDVDCVITAREILMLAETRNISFPQLPRRPISSSSVRPFPDRTLDCFLFPERHPEKRRRRNQPPAAGSSGGYLHHILQTQLASSPNSSLHTTRGRNGDVLEYRITQPSSQNTDAEKGADTEIFKSARYYGFNNIQNLVRKLKPAKASRMPGASRGPKALGSKTKNGMAVDYAYVEVMACPGGCTNGGGQIKVEDIGGQGVNQREWLEKVDEAYFSMSDEDDGNISNADDQTYMGLEKNDDDDNIIEQASEHINGIDISAVRKVLRHWEESTGIALRKLCYTSFREVQSDVGKDKTDSAQGGLGKVIELTGKIGGGW